MMQFYVDKKALAESIITFLIWTVGISVVYSLAYCSYLHLSYGANWDVLSKIGDFWGGHLGSIALIFLAFSFNYQRLEFQKQKEDSENYQKAMEAQTQEMERQCKASESQVELLGQSIEQSGFHFSFKIASEIARSYEFKIKHDKKINTYNGLRSLSQFLEVRDCSSPDLEIIVDIKSFVKTYHLCQVFSGVLKNTIEHSLSVIMVDSIFPQSLDILMEDIEDQKNHQVKLINASDLSDYMIKDALQLIHSGWQFSIRKGDQFYKCTLHNQWLDKSICKSGTTSDLAIQSVLIEKSRSLTQ